MLHIAEIQVARENQIAQESNEYIFCDTSPLTTLFYSNHLFGKADAALEHMAKRVYDLVVLCAPDFPFAQDGTRQDASFRTLQHEWYLRELRARRVPFLLVTGSISDRVAQIQKSLPR